MHDKNTHTHKHYDTCGTYTSTTMSTDMCQSITRPKQSFLPHPLTTPHHTLPYLTQTHHTTPSLPRTHPLTLYHPPSQLTSHTHSLHTLSHSLSSYPLLPTLSPHPLTHPHPLSPCRRRFVWTFWG